MTTAQEIYDEFKSKQDARKTASRNSTIVLETLLIIDMLCFIIILINLPLGLVLFGLFILITGGMLIYDSKFCGDMPSVERITYKPVVSKPVESRTCPTCHGSGRCQYCYGTGHYGKSSAYGHGHDWPCTPCNSSGACRTCEGRGWK